MSAPWGKVPPEPKRPYEVIVGNIGTVYTGTSRRKADEVWDEYVKLSIGGTGRAANEDVTLMFDDEPVREHQGRSYAGLKKLGNVSMGICPVCEEAPSYPWTIPGQPDGYVEACNSCAPDAVDEEVSGGE